jgi:large subunit ribosomal protein L9
MKIILLKNVAKLGKALEIKEVAEGFGRNYLIAKGLARAATPENLKWVQGQRAIIQQEAEDELKRTGNVAANLDGLEIELPVKVGDKGQLFEKISGHKIANRLKELGYDVGKAEITVEQEIKEPGEYTAKVEFEHNLEAQLKIVVIPNNK